MRKESDLKTGIVCKALEEKKGQEIRVIDISEISTLADYFVIVNGGNERQVQTLFDAVDEAMSKAGFEPRQTEGKNPTMWLLLDYNDVVVHILNEEGRKFYDLEHLWRDGKDIPYREFMTDDPETE